MAEMRPRKARPSSSVATLLLLALLFGTHVPFARAAQSQQRERRVNTQTPAPAQTPAPTPTPTPTAAPAPLASPTPERSIVRPGASPTPTPSPVPVAVPAPARTLEELQSRIREIVARPEFASSHLAVKITSLDTGRVLFEENANRWLQPASNMKLYVVAAALDRFGPDYRFVTSVYAPQRPDASGAVRGDLIVYGRGDPTYATRFNGDESGDYYRGIDELASRIVAAGVRRVEGDLVGDESYFTGAPYGLGWEWDDLQWWYGAEVSALSVNDNSVDLSVKPGPRPGDPAVITFGPATQIVTVVDRTVTAPRGTQRELSVHRPLGQNVLEVLGRIAVDDRGYNASVAITNPALMFATMLRTSLERRGVVFTGRTRTVNAQSRADGSPLPVSSLVEVATRQSPPLSVVAAQTMKPSQNLYTELLLRALGKATATDARRSSEAAGIEAVKNFLRGAGVDADKVVMLDGSGLSRGNLVTADSTVRLLVHMNRHPHGAVFREAQPVAGVDGTLRNRMKGTAAQGNVRAKTGTLGTATSLSGYVFSAAGERLVFSLMINNPPRQFDARENFTDAIAVLLANFTGRS